MSDRWKERKAWSIDRDARCFEALVRLWQGGRMWRRTRWAYSRGNVIEHYITGPGPDAKQLDLSRAVVKQLVKLNLVAAPTGDDRQYLLVPPQRRDLVDITAMALTSARMHAMEEICRQADKEQPA